MHDGEGLSNGQSPIEQAPTASDGPTSNTVAVEVAAVAEDAMDTTPDTDVQLVLPDGSASQVDISAEQPLSPNTNGAGREEADVSVQTEAATATEDAVSAKPTFPYDQ